ncbi:MAG: amino acid adenylation domain-containing protein [Hydrococcus sp. Prado102]|jgi:amino acid adenylation domain-containing protein/thioester reductase-like protein|nr:amino acid adenylation domain-containing protein [Hydrococcus sp. Prado102]
MSSSLLPNQAISVCELIELQVSKTPDAVAVIFGERQLTYRELNEKANQLARYLKELGVKPDVLVGVYLERSLDLIIALVAILKAGGAYLPLDISYPSDRLRLMVEDAQATILLTQSHLLERLSELEMRSLCLDNEAEAIAQYSKDDLQSEAIPDNLAYVIYTSGSTGRPKGVAMPHSSLVNLLAWQNQQSSSAIGYRTLQFTPISFDVSFQEIFSTLSSGGILVLIPDATRRDPSKLLQFLDKAAIERLFLPFVALRQLAEAIERESILPKNLKEVITAGEQLRITPAIVNWFAQMPKCTLHNHYGPSETHVVTSYTLTGEPQTWTTLPPIGQPLPNTQIYILDSRLQPVPAEVSGEIYIGGICLAREYLNRADLTAERFIHNPFSKNPEERLYKTGDLARYLPDGNIEYLGRIDQQVKIRGFRIEPAEVERLLERHPQVREAVVMTRENPLGDKCLVAYITPLVTASQAGEGTSSFARNLRQFVRSQVPDYMVPSAFVVLEEFLLTPSGKVDRRALPIPQWTRVSEETYVAPRTSVETQLAQIWSQLLGLEKISIYDDFCELGGNSLLAIQLVYRVGEAFDLEIPLENFLEGPTIAGMAQTIEALRHTNTADRLHQNLEAETELDASIYPQPILDQPIPEIFLTGATGFLGAFFLYELLKQTRADVYCLIRASKLEEARARIQSALKRYSLWDDSFDSRIVLVLGDLTQPYLGISQAQFSRLAEKIDIIYHCGAWVNVVYPYSALKAANVLGTQEVLRLATQTRIKPVHFISTVDVFANASDGSIRTITEKDAIGDSRYLWSGYAQSKYVAEKLVIAAASRGLPVSIYRPSNIIGHSQTGIGSTKSFIALMLKGCLQMGIAPELKATLNLIPVNSIARAIANLSQQEPCGRSFHIVNPHSIEWQELLSWMTRQGYQLEQVSYQSWCEQLLKLAANSSDNVLVPLQKVVTNRHLLQKLLGAFHFENKNPFACPPVDDELLKTFFAYLAQSGLVTSIPELSKVSVVQAHY